MDKITFIVFGLVAVAAVFFVLKRGSVPAELKAQVESGDVQLVDVREPGEWSSGHLLHATSVPLSQLKAGKKPKLDPKKPIALHCASGMRVRSAKPILEEMGFQEVTALSAGYGALVSAGFPRAE